MQLLIPPNIEALLINELMKAGRREIGGVLMGEHVGPDTFRIRDFTVQRKGGTFAAFVRLVSGIVAPLRHFFDTTKHEYMRFNYLGEWHSHHSFELSPSGRDHVTMLTLVNDPELGALFVALLLVRLDLSSRKLECSVTVYLPNHEPILGEAVCEKCEREAS